MNGASSRPACLLTASNKKIEVVINGQVFESLQSAASAFGVSRNTVQYRLSKGWTPEEAVGLEPRPKHAANTPGISVVVRGKEFKNIKQAAKHFGRSYTHIFERLNAGCSIEEALGLVERPDSLQTEYPELANQWHPTKNAPLAPDAVPPHSGQKAWWLCSHGHEWEAVVNSRTRGHGCPYCAGQRPTAERNFATESPYLLEEWDWKKNRPHKPEQLSPRSQTKVWWRCRHGHSWKATISNRARDTKNLCPCCLNRTLCADNTNSLSALRPDIANDWHPHKNGSLTPRDVVAGGYKKVWWICKHGHDYRTTVGARVNAGTGCSKCSLQTSRMEIAVYCELDALFGGVAWREKVAGFECDVYLSTYNIGVEVDGVYWHRRRPDAEIKKSGAFDKAGIQLFRLREEGLSHLSERDVSFKSTEDHFVVVSRLVKSLLDYAELPAEPQEKLRNYSAGPGLINEKAYRKNVASLPAPPPGESLADKQPEIAKQWAYDLNAPLSPEHFRHKSNKIVWWRCEQGHTWKVSINNRTQHGTGCASCPPERVVTVTKDWNLAAVFPDLANEWHPEKNGDLRPEGVRPKSNQKVWWLCGNGHEWQTGVNNRAGGSGCPYCYGRFPTKENNLASKFPELLPEWDAEKNEGLDPADFTPHVNKKVWWRCEKGHSWRGVIANRTLQNSGCPHCARAASRKYSIADFRAIAEKRGGKCLSTEFTSVRQQLKLQCREGHVWETRADSVLYTTKWCPVCGRYARQGRGPNQDQLSLKFIEPK